MPLVPDFLINAAVIESQGVPKDEARRLGILPALLNLPMAQSLLVSTLIGKNNAPKPPAASFQPAPGPIKLVKLIDLTGSTFEDAKGKLDELGLVVNEDLVDVTNQGYKPTEVIAQDPAPDTLVPVGSTVTLIVQVEKPADPGEPAGKAALARSVRSKKPAESKPDAG